MSTMNVNNDFNLIRIERPQGLTRAERIEANERKITRLESELSLRKDNINITKNLISSNNEEISILEQLKASNEKLLGYHQDQRGATVKVIEISNKLIEGNNKLIDLMKQSVAVIEKMLSIMEKNPARYGGLPTFEVQKQPETEVKLAYMKADKELFSNSGKCIEVALDKKHETLAIKAKDVRQSVNTPYYKPLESFSRINRLAYLDLAIKGIKV